MVYADSIAILHNGKIEQRGTPAELYAHPKSAYIASFFGDVNILCKKTIERFALDIPVNTSCGIRACDFSFAQQSGKSDVEVEVVEKIYMGNHDKLHVKTADGCRLELELPAGESSGAHKLFLSVDPARVLLFS